MCEQCQDPLAYVGESPIRRAARRVLGWEPVPIPDDEWLDDDELGDDAHDFAAGVAAMREVERDWWASAFDA